MKMLCKTYGNRGIVMVLDDMDNTIGGFTLDEDALKELKKDITLTLDDIANLGKDLTEG